MSKRYMQRREYNAIIAGLRSLGRSWTVKELSDILMDGVDEPIDDDGIDALIEALQFDEVQLDMGPDEYIGTIVPIDFDKLPEKS